MGKKQSDAEFSAEETERRFIAALRGARSVGHKDREEMKLGKPRTRHDSEKD